MEPCPRQESRWSRAGRFLGTIRIGSTLGRSRTLRGRHGGRGNTSPDATNSHNCHLATGGVRSRKFEISKTLMRFRSFRIDTVEAVNAPSGWSFLVFIILSGHQRVTDPKGSYTHSATHLLSRRISEKRRPSQPKIGGGPGRPETARDELFPRDLFFCQEAVLSGVWSGAPSPCRSSHV